MFLNSLVLNSHVNAMHVVKLIYKVRGVSEKKMKSEKNYVKSKLQITSSPPTHTHTFKITSFDSFPIILRTSGRILPGSLSSNQFKRRKRLKLKPQRRQDYPPPTKKHIANFTDISYFIYQPMKKNLKSMAEHGYPRLEGTWQ